MAHCAFRELKWAFSGLRQEGRTKALAESANLVLEALPFRGKVGTSDARPGSSGTPPSKF